MQKLFLDQVSIVSTKIQELKDEYSDLEDTLILDRDDYEVRRLKLIEISKKLEPYEKLAKGLFEIAFETLNILSDVVTEWNAEELERFYDLANKVYENQT